MTYEEIVKITKKEYEHKRVRNMQGKVALQINIFGEARGAFYIEFVNGRIEIQPYEYFDRDAVISSNADDFIKIIKGELSITDAYNQERIFVDGDLGAVLWIEKIEKY